MTEKGEREREKEKREEREREGEGENKNCSKNDVRIHILHFTRFVFLLILNIHIIGYTLY